jgi:parvulin-like peptidyl-prolyl isomerase
MTKRILAVTGLLLALAASRPLADGTGLPLRNGKPVVAVVNDGAITLSAFLAQRQKPDAGRIPEGIGDDADLALLDRLVNVELIVQEAATMGISDMPEIRRQVDVTSRSLLREVLMNTISKDVKADPASVEAAFEDLTREWKTASVLFTSEDAARQFREAVSSGADWAQASAQAVADKKARGEDDGKYHQKKEFLPEFATALSALKPGEVSPVIHIQAGFVILRLLDIRYPENTTARAEAEKTAKGAGQESAIGKFEEDVWKQRVVVKQAVLDGIDYEKKTPTLEALLVDTRVLAVIKGGDPVTVGDLTEYLKLQFFHGGDRAGQLKRMNDRKRAAFDATVSRRVMNIEALHRGIDKTDEYIDRLADFEDSLVFDAFVRKVVEPDSKLKEAEVRAYYDGHLAEFSSPEMLRIRSLAFVDRKAAEAAIGQLREGADFGWLVANAEGQVDKAAAGLLTFDGRPVTTASMPEGLQKAVTGAKAGESRLYGSEDGRFYVLSVQDVVTPTAQAYDEVKGTIAKKLYGGKLKKNVEEYAAKLRAASKVDTYLRKAD